MASSSSFFLKRWLDNIYLNSFCKNFQEDAPVSSWSPIWLCTLMGTLGGLVAGMANFIAKGDTDDAWMGGAIVVCLIAQLTISTITLVKTQKYVKGVGRRFLRALKLLLVTLIFTYMAFVLGYFLVLVALVIIILLIVFKVGFGGRGSGTSTITLDDGTVITVKRGPTGEDLFIGNDGCTDVKNNDGTFSKS